MHNWVWREDVYGRATERKRIHGISRADIPSFKKATIPADMAD